MHIYLVCRGEILLLKEKVRTLELENEELKEGRIDDVIMGDGTDMAQVG